MKAPGWSDQSGTATHFLVRLPTRVKKSREIINYSSGFLSIWSILRKSLISEKDLREQLGMNAQQYIFENFNPNTYIKELNQIYDMA